MGNMKDSGIEWIGMIPEEWNYGRIKYLFVNGKDGIKVGPFGSSLTEAVVGGDIGKYKIYGQANLIRKDFGFGDNFVSEKDYHRLKNYEVLSGDIAVSMMGTIGKCSVVPENIEKGIMDSHLIKIRLSNKMLPQYFEYHYEAEAVYEQLVMNSKGSIMNGLNSSIVKNLYFCFPSIEEQQLIANFLDDKVGKIDDILADLRKQVETLQKYKKSVITKAVTKGLNPNAQMKDSGIDWIGEIPESWEYKRLKYLLKQNCVNLRVGPFGSSLSGSDIKDEGYWVYNQRCVLDKNFEYNDTYVDEEKFRELYGFRVFPNDVLITTRGTIGKVAIVPQNAPEGILHPCIIKFVLDEKLINNKLIEYIFNESEIITEQIFRQSNSTTIEVIYSYTLKDLVLPVIPEKEQQQIVDYLDDKCSKIDELIKDKEAQIEKMEKYKKSLIYEYVTGKKRVKGAV